MIERRTLIFCLLSAAISAAAVFAVVSPPASHASRKRPVTNVAITDRNCQAVEGRPEVAID